MRISALFPLAAFALLPSAPQSTEIRLGQRTGVIEEAFSELSGFHELKDGRAFVSDRIDQAVYAVDFATGSRKVLGRTGTGPSEYLTPFGPVPWIGDTVLVYDPNNRRYAKLRTDGVFAGTIPFVVRTGGGAWATPRGVDAAGRLYWDSPIIQMEPEVKRLPKARIVRWRPGMDSVETVMEFQDHAAFEHRFRYRPIPQTDAWIIGNDGRIGILSAVDYQLRWYRDGKLVESGPQIPYERVKIGAAERDAFRAKKALEPMSGAAPAGGSNRPQLMGMERAKAAWGDTLFPEFMPPFEVGGAMRAPNGNIWVKRTMPASERSQRLDVLDARGALRGFVRLAPRSRLIAVSASSVYVIAIDEDGLQTLERYAMPVQLAK